MSEMTKYEEIQFEESKELKLKCNLCNKELQGRFVRIERGDFDFEDRNNDNIKYNCFICSKCYLEDIDLCRFFNKIGDNVR